MDRIFELLVSFLGGGFVTGIVTIFIQRNHKKKDEQRDLYKNLRDKLCHYKNDIDDILISFYRNTNMFFEKINIDNNNLRRIIEEVNQQTIDLNIQYNKCTSCNKYNENKCSHLNNAIDIINKNIDFTKKKHNEIKCKLHDFDINYWKKNNDIYNIINKYKNLINYLGLIKKQSKTLIKQIGIIDKYTFQLISLLQSNETKSNDIILHCHKLIEQINITIITLDKDNN